MFCPNCGNQISASTKFCPSCGAAVAQNSGAANAQQNTYQQQTYQQQNGYQTYQQSYQQAPAGAYRAPIKKRNIALCIIFSIITLGIYGIYWQICIVNDLNTASGRTQDTSGGVVFLLSLITCNIYGLYWLYTAGNKVNIVKQRNGMVADGNNGLIYLLLALFSAGIISYCLIQSELNNVATLE